MIAGNIPKNKLKATEEALIAIVPLTMLLIKNSNTS